MKRTVAAVVAVVLVAAGGAGWYVYRTVTRPIDLEAPPPAVLPDGEEVLPELPLSTVEAPISYDLGPAVRALEDAVPRAFGDIENRLQAGTNKRLFFAFAAARAPFTVKIDGLRITISSVIEFEGRGWYDPIIGPTVSAACGTSGVPRPRVRATLVSTASLTPEWTLRTKTRLASLEPYSDDTRDRCRVTVFRIDVTDRVINATRGVLEQQLATLDRNIAQIDTRSAFAGWWRRLQLPIRLADSIYLTLEPRAAALGSVTEQSGALVANVRLSVRPRVLTGGRPNDFDLLTPLPPLRKDNTVGSGLQVAIEGSFTYPVATDLLRRAINGKRVQQAGRTVTITDVSLSGIGAGKVALGVELGGDVRGKVYFTGTPQIDTAARQVVVPDLDYDVGSANLLVRGFEWLKGEDLRNFLRARARLPDSEGIDRLRELAEKGMNRDLTPGVSLQATIRDARGVAVRATTQNVRVRAVAEGEARLVISRGLNDAGKTVASKKGGEGKK